jgi:quercetin dioxygenase-like cupin family protein
MSADMGGDPPCWAHLFDDDATRTGSFDVGQVVAVDLGTADTSGRSGVVWSLPHGGDLDVNLVHLQPDDSIGAHVNDEVDVVMTVIAGRGRVSIDGTSHELRSEVLVAVPKGSRREIFAGADGITYLSIHRRRQPLGIR